MGASIDVAAMVSKLPEGECTNWQLVASSLIIVVASDALGITIAASKGEDPPEDTEGDRVGDVRDELELEDEKEI